MITMQEEKFILSRAYVPEHSVGLMTRVSGGEPLLLDDFLCCRGEDWIILVAYPLEHSFDPDEMESLVRRVREKFQPRYLSLMAPEMPQSVAAACRERESDRYYTLELGGAAVKSRPLRVADRAREHLRVEESRVFLDSHRDRIREFIARVQPPPRVRALLARMPEYVASSDRSLLLNAWESGGELAAFYVIDLAPSAFSSYVIGCHSRKVSARGASDLLCAEMIRISEEQGKGFIHLGLGVNRGVRQFKKKWGGRPTLGYEMGELVLRRPSLMDALRAMTRKAGP